MKRKIAFILILLLTITSILKTSPYKSYAFIMTEDAVDMSLEEDESLDNEVPTIVEDKPLENIEIYEEDRKEVTLSFDTNEGDEISSQTFDREDLIEELPIPKRSGYEFDGWYFDDDTKIELPIDIDSDTTIYAKWIQKEDILMHGDINLYNRDHLDDFYEVSDRSVINYNIYPESDFSFLNIYRTKILSENMSPKIGKDHPVNPGDVMLFKEAKPTPGRVNTWDITVRIEGKNKPTTSDIVLVIDRSGSMRDYERMDHAKDAAYAFINALLPSDFHRIAVVSYAFDVTTNWGLTNDISNLRDAIGGLWADGGTFTQAGIRQAKAILENSNADNKHIVLLSDGEPTFSYLIDEPNNYANQWVSNVISSPGNYYRSGRQTSSAIPEEHFLYPYREGDGRSMRYAYESPSTNLFYFYNHGNSAIAEARFAGFEGFNVFTIGLQTNEMGNRILKSMRQIDGSFTEVTDPSELKDVYTQIAGKINSAVIDAKVEDPLGTGFEILDKDIENISITDGEFNYQNNKISWDIGTLSKPIYERSDVYYAELKYTVEINDEILDEIPDVSDKYPTNGKTTLDYKDVDGNRKTRDFNVPKVNPIFYKFIKEIQDIDGNIIDEDKDFTMNLVGSNGFNENININPKLNSRLRTDLRYPGTYNFKEEVKDEDYEISYFINGQSQISSNFEIVDNENEDVIVKVINKKRAGKLIIEKEFNKGELKDNPKFEFKVTGPKGYEKIFSLPEDNIWTKELNYLNWGEYKIEELSKDYETEIKVNDREIKKSHEAYVLIEEGKLINKVHILNKYNKTTLRIEKRNKEDESKLKGAEFTLFSSDDSWKKGEISLTIRTDQYGQGEFRGLIPGKYILKETKTPDGFVSEYDYYKVNISESGMITIFSDNGSHIIPRKSLDGKGIFILYNTPISPLPMTGGNGNNSYRLMGSIFIFTSVITIIKRKRIELISLKGGNND